MFGFWDRDLFCAATARRVLLWSRSGDDEVGVVLVLWVRSWDVSVVVVLDRIVGIDVENLTLERMKNRYNEVESMLKIDPQYQSRGGLEITAR